MVMAIIIITNSSFVDGSDLEVVSVSRFQTGHAAAFVVALEG